MKSLLVLILTASSVFAALPAHPRAWWDTTNIAAAQAVVVANPVSWQNRKTVLDGAGGAPNYNGYTLGQYANNPGAVVSLAEGFIQTGTGGSTTNGNANYGNAARVWAINFMQYFCPTDFLVGPYTITAISTPSGMPVTITTSTPSGFLVGSHMTFTGISGMTSLNGTPAGYGAGYYVASIISSTQFTLTTNGDGSTSSGGTVHIGGDTGEPWCFFNGNDIRAYAWPILLTYDWTYSLWSPAEIAEFQAFISAATIGNGTSTGAENTFQTYATISCGAAGCNTAASQYMMVLLGGVVSYGDNPTDMGNSNQQIDWIFTPTTGKYYTDIKPWFITTGPFVTAARGHYGAEGVWAEGPEYGPDEYRMNVYADWAAKTAGIFDVFSDSSGTNGNLAKEMALSLVNMTSPTITNLGCGTATAKTLASWGDQQSPYALDVHINKGVGRVLSYYLANYASDPTTGGYLSTWANNVQPFNNGWGDCGSNDYFPEMFDDMFPVAPVALSGLTTDYTSVNMGVGFFRSDWTSGASWLTWKGGGAEVGQLHARGAFGTFNLWRNGVYLTGARPAYGYTCSELGNGLMLGGLSSGTGGSGFGVAVPSDILSETFPKFLESSSAYAAVQVDQAPNYVTNGGVWGYNTATQLLHDFVWFKGAGGAQPDFVAILDRYTFSSGQASRRSIHTGAKTPTESLTADPPTVASNTMQALNIGPNNGKLFATNLGAGSYSTIDDNAGFKCWQGVDDYSVFGSTITSITRSANVVTGTMTVPDFGQVSIGNTYTLVVEGVADTSFNFNGSVTIVSSTTFTYNQAGANASSSGGTMGFGHYYHVNLSTGTNDTQVTYFTAIEGTDSTNSKTAVTDISASGYKALHWSYSPDDKVAVFSDHTNGTGITMPITYSFTKAASTSTHLISDLPASSNINVSLGTVGSTVTVTLASSGAGTNLTSSANGVLCFTNSFTSCTSSGPTCTISPGSLPSGTVGISYSQTLTAINCGMGTLTWTITGTEPTGLSGCNSVTGVTCSITGTPSTTSGSPFNFTVAVSDGGSNMASQAYSVAISSSGPSNGSILGGSSKIVGVIR